MLGVETRFPAPDRFSGASDRLHELAEEQIGSADFGETDYLPGLRVLLESMDYDPRFTEAGRTIAWGALLTTLCGRGMAAQQLKHRQRKLRVKIAILEHPAMSLNCG